MAGEKIMTVWIVFFADPDSIAHGLEAIPSWKVAALPPALRDEITALWDEYEAAATPEARIAKGLDKLETIMQHNQGLNPADFDYRFNLGYGRKHTADIPLVAEVRKILDDETEQRAREADQRSARA